MKIGIDLGTTNSALAFIDPGEAAGADFPPVHILHIPQQLAGGQPGALRTLPSFLFLEGDSPVGEHAREQGALVPTRLVHSAKSWLSNPEVDRTAKILPWDAQQAGRVISPVEASARYISQLKTAWEASGRGPIAGHDVVLTVPASFDEEARELTVQAARDAGIENLTLLEEPAAAFYSWIANHLSQSQKSLTDGMTVLIVDVGGGTSDFTLIRVARENDRVTFTRTAVGRHLLLGGDNLDLTLAWLAESKLSKQLSLRQRSALRRRCSAAKEKLLGPDQPPSAEITVLGGGTSLIGGTLKAEILREEALELALDGFLPFCSLDDKPQDDDKSPYREVGLPYVSDPAVTRHLAAFLRSSQSPAPDAILFNGGFFIPEILRRRVTDVVESWYSKRPLVFENNDLDLAVAVGAAYYSYVRGTGAGVLVRGGLPRAYFLGLDAPSSQTIKTVCLVPRGTEEGSTLSLELENLQLVANKPVSFRLYSSLVRTEDQAGDLVTFDPAEDLHQHAPLEAVIRFGRKAEERLVPVRLGARLTEVGTLEIWAESKISENRWRLQFELRKPVLAEQAKAARPVAVIPADAAAAAEVLIRDVFVHEKLTPEALPARLEQALALGRNSWPLEVIRKLADLFLDLNNGRRNSPAHELRWLNLAGLCLRPGFGHPADDYRIELARRVWAQGLAFDNKLENETQWWIFWGRVAGGLNRNQQEDVFRRLAWALMPKGKPPRVNSSLEREMWRCAASLELLPAGVRTELGNSLVKKLLAQPDPSSFWCLARIGARRLFHAPANHVLPASTAARWIDSIAKLPAAEETIARLAQTTGDAARDLSPASLEMVRRTLADSPGLLALFSGEAASDLDSLARVFGEDLPSGLVLSHE
ncbi:MAG: Hsp70 family protein [Candidatus Solibacter usitatus]|nr:Hsp70 family protein [Candidatus Solibacter usitatus]